MATLKTSPLIEIAKTYATKCHQETNHMYDGKPYITHLQMVFELGEKFAPLYFDHESIPTILAACWTHDVIEDTRQTYNDVKNVCGEIVANITYALTNEKGKNRKERANEKYYLGITQTPFATFVKLCDRLANVQYSVDMNSAMIEVYRKENKDFKQALWNPTYQEMFEELDKLLT